MNRTIAQWVEYIQTLHNREIDLTLERVHTVYRALLPMGVDFKVVSIAGTNGKGSTAELLASLYRAEGYRVGKYTSPHLLRFNERITVGGEEISDHALQDSLEQVEKARGDTPLTFFEFGTLAAIHHFSRRSIEVAIMEVGLGGRLDAVNILDADVSVITSISIDHTSWLGNTVDQIAVEKAGIARPDRPCLLGLRQPPDSLTRVLEDIGANIEILGREFDYRISNETAWRFQSGSSQSAGDQPNPVTIGHLPLPFAQRGVQLDNAALAIQASRHLSASLPVGVESIRRGLTSASIAGRCQIIQRTPLVIVDVSHNEASVSRLAEFLRGQAVRGQVFALCGMLRDKDIASALSVLVTLVDCWNFVSIEGERGSHANELLRIFTTKLGGDAGGDQVTTADTAEQAYHALLPTLTDDDCLLVFGSFFVASDILRVHENTRRL